MNDVVDNLNKATSVPDNATPQHSTSSLNVLEFFESLPLSLTTAIAVASSVVIVAAISRALPGAWLWVAALVIPTVVSTILYWIPAILRRDYTPEYSAWALAFIGMWAFFSTIATLLFVFLRQWRGRGTGHV